MFDVKNTYYTNDATNPDGNTYYIDVVSLGEQFYQCKKYYKYSEGNNSEKVLSDYFTKTTRQEFIATNVLLA